MRHYDLRSYLLNPTLALLLLAAAPAAAQAPLGCLDAFEREVVDLVNVERSLASLPPLEVDVRLMQAAELHSDDMATNNFVSHTGTGGTSMVDRIEAAGYQPWTRLSENVAAGYASPAAVVAAWMASPGHRANILDAAVTDLGVGYAFGPGTTYGHYWTQDFGATPTPLESPADLCAECSNGVHDDADGYLDFPADPGCRDPAGAEAPACDDGLDNDGDGGIDFAGSPPDSFCSEPWGPRERPIRGCGLGFEVALVLLASRALLRRRSGNRAGAS